MSQVEARLAELGLTVPDVVAPVAAYVPALRTGNYIFTSGQLPFVKGELTATGIVGKDVDEETAAKAAEMCALNIAPDFTKQPVVINGASNLLGKAFGDAGVHARSAVGVASLPMNTPVEVEAIVEVRD